MLNELFRLGVMSSATRKGGNRPIDRALKWALEERGWRKARFAAEMGVSPANVTNWIARGLPPEHHEKVAKILKKSVDELLGKEKKEAWDPTATWPFDIPYREFDKLKPAQKADIGEMVEDRVRRFKAKNGPKDNNTDA